MIRSFKDKATEAVFNNENPKGFPAPVEVARRKLKLLNAASNLNDLRVPSGNRLEALKGDRKGSIRSGSTTSTGSASSGPMQGLNKSK